MRHAEEEEDEEEEEEEEEEQSPFISSISFLSFLLFHSHFLKQKDRQVRNKYNSRSPEPFVSYGVVDLVLMNEVLQKIMSEMVAVAAEGAVLKLNTCTRMGSDSAIVLECEALADVRAQRHA